MSQVSGLLGLAPSDKDTNFVQTLFEQNQIAAEIFAFKQGDLNTASSELLVGSFDKNQIERPVESHIGDKDFIIWQRTHSLDSWALPFNDFRYGEESLMEDTYKVVVDIGKTHSFLPDELYGRFERHMKKLEGLECNSNSCQYPASKTDSCLHPGFKDIYV